MDAFDSSIGSEMLRRFAQTVDLAWQQARQRGAPLELVVALGEASHGLHRALITVQDSSPWLGGID